MDKKELNKRILGKLIGKTPISAFLIQINKKGGIWHILPKNDKVKPYCNTIKQIIENKELKGRYLDTVIILEEITNSSGSRIKIGTKPDHVDYEEWENEESYVCHSCISSLREHERRVGFYGQ